MRIFQTIFDQRDSKSLCSPFSKVYLTVRMAEITYYIWSHFCPVWLIRVYQGEAIQFLYFFLLFILRKKCIIRIQAMCNALQIEELEF